MSSLPDSIPEPHGRDVSKIPGLDQLLQPLDYELVGALAAYTPRSVASPGASPSSSPVPAQSRFIVELGNGPTAYYDIGLDGSDPHLLPLRIPCFAYLSLTQDSQWGACLTA